MTDPANDPVFDQPTAPALPTATGQVPQRLGAYRLMREIARGGMGVVYEAEDEQLGRRVAIKVLPANLFANDKARERFRREAQAAARLHHTNIVPVFDVGEEHGYCFYVMQRIDGKGLDKQLGHGMAPRDAARVGVQVADALAYAHAHGVLHRDIKPSNLLLDAAGDVWVTDFGVAKLISETNVTQSGELVGTLRYMPAERFLGKSDARGDVYSLGMTLYELLAGKPAFPDATPHHLIQMISQAAIPSLRKVVPDVPADLETVVLKAAAREPEHRYQTAAELANDLRRFLDDRPVRARRVGPAGQLLRWCRRNRVVAALSAVALALLLVTAVVSSVAYLRTAAANQEADEALKAEQAQRAHAENTSAQALEALNRIYNRFAPSRFHIGGVPVASAGADEEDVDIPHQPVLSREAVPILEELLGFYEQLAREGSDYPKLRSRAAEANQRIGDIRQRLGQYDQAIAAYQKAAELYTDPATGRPAEGARLKLARAQNELGRAYQALERISESQAAHAAALATLNGAPAEVAIRAEYRYELARTHYFMARRQLVLAAPGPGAGRRGPLDGRGRPGLPPPLLARIETPPAQKAVTILEELVRDHPDVPDYRQLLACCYRDVYRDVPAPFSPGKKPPADRALELLRQLVKDFPAVPDYRHDLCETLAWTAVPRRALTSGLDVEVRQRLEEARDLAVALVAEFPHVPQYRFSLAQVYEGLGLLYYFTKQLHEAEEAWRQALAAQSHLAEHYPEVVNYSLILGIMECRLGRLLHQRGQPAEARRLLEAGTDRVATLLARNRRLAYLAPTLASFYGELAQMLKQQGEKEAAAQAQRKAEALSTRRIEILTPREE